MAVIAGVETAVQIHIDRGDDLNARDNNGMTPLMIAAARDKPAICRMLLAAGADHTLLDPTGKTALDIANAAGSAATAGILRALRAPVPTSLQSEIALEDGQERANASSQLSAPKAARATSAAPAATAELASPTTPAAAQTRSPASPLVVVDKFDDGEFDLSGWETESEPTRPDEDVVLLASACAVQIAISGHQPIDSAAEWDDIDAYLPDVALPLARASDSEGRARLKRLLLRALREGSVPALEVQNLSSNEDRSSNPEAEAFLAMVINDLGAEVDERFEYASNDESFEVFVDPAETPEEEAAVDEALAAIDRAASPRHEPLRIYQRDFQRIRLLTAEEEIGLARGMEAALDTALDALATWPEGIARTLAAAEAAIAGTRPLSSIWSGDEPDPEPASAEALEAEALGQVEPEDSADEDGEPEDGAPADAGKSTFAEAVRQLAGLVEREDGPKASPLEIRQALTSLRLDRRFLLELIDAAKGTAPCHAFARAMAEFRKARDRMATANLKLAFFYAKKYLHSGEPLDDLAQEGNIGLLKAVDRYDWRRGFRFSTYATWWVRQQISRYIADKARTIRVPAHVFEKLQRAERTAQTFESTFGREPTLAELAERLELPPQKLAALLRIAPEASSIDEETVDNMIAIDARDAYEFPDPADVVHDIKINRAVDEILSALATKDRRAERILRLRFGIGIDEALTLDEIGTLYEVTRERIRQIEVKAIEWLKNPSRLDPCARRLFGSGRAARPNAAEPQRAS